MPSPTFHLALRSPRPFAQQEEIACARTTFAAQPDLNELRLKLAALLATFDSPDTFDEAIDLLRHAAPPVFPTLDLLALSLLDRKHPGDFAEAAKVAVQALGSTNIPTEKAASLTNLGRALCNVDRPAEGRAALQNAIQLDPTNREASRALNTLDLQRPDARQQATAKGATYAYTASFQQISLARLGQLQEARKIQGLGRFLHQGDPPTPPQWPTHAAFHAALAEEILTHPDLRFERRDTTKNRTSFVNHPTLERTPALRALDVILQQEISAYVARLLKADPDAHDPFLNSRPGPARLRSWCVVSETIGHEEWHVHSHGWLSGVYYIQVPDHVANGTGPEGCLTFGIPEHLAGEQAAQQFGQHPLRPHTGLMALFPSHAWHRTFPHGAQEKRICYSFDVNPLPPS